MTISMLSRILVLATVVLILGVLWLAVSISHSQRIAAQPADTHGVLPAAAAAPKPVASMIRVAYPPPVSASRDDAGTLPSRNLRALPDAGAQTDAGGQTAPSEQQAVLVQQSSAAGPTPAPLPSAIATGKPSSAGQGDPAAAAPRSILPTRVSATDQAVEPIAPTAAQNPSTEPGAARPTDPNAKLASLGGDAAGAAATPVETEPGDAVDINSASIDALNHLKGGGAIGYTIARHRPYRSIDELLTKRVLRRSVFEQIKAQITSR